MEAFYALERPAFEVCKRIEGEDVGDTSQAGTLFGPTLPRAAPRRGRALLSIGR